MSLTEREMLAWIKTASYEDLLRKWRTEPIGSPWFREDVGACFEKAFARARGKLSVEEVAEISKRVGWTYPTSHSYEDKLAHTPENRPKK